MSLFWLIIGTGRVLIRVVPPIGATVAPVIALVGWIKMETMVDAKVRLSIGPVVVAILIALGSTPAQAQGAPSGPDGPEVSTFLVAQTNSLANPDFNPPGANDWSCRPTVRHPRPVIFVHGTFASAYTTWASAVPRAKRAGYCVFALNYGDSGDAAVGAVPAVNGYGDIRESAKELAAFVDRVREATGSDQVDLVGHSQGGMMPRQYLKFEGGADPANPANNKVHTLITLGATHHGTTLLGIGTLASASGITGLTAPALGRAAMQQVVGSEFLANLNEGGDTMPGVNYLVLATRFDEVSTPPKATFLKAGPGAKVTNILIQDGCFLDVSDHLSLSYSPAAIGYILHGLADFDSIHPAAPAPLCAPKLPLL